MKRFPWPFVVVAILLLAVVGLSLADPQPRAPPPAYREQVLHLPTQTHRNPHSDEAFCAEERAFAEESNRHVPEMVDSLTRVDGTSVDCAARLTVVRKTVLVDRRRMIPGWRAAAHAGLSRHICENPALAPMYRRGWRWVTEISFTRGPPERIEVYCR